MEYNQEEGKWAYSKKVVMDPPQHGNGKYRVFLDASPNTNFTNMPYIRTLAGSATTHAFYEPATKTQEERPQVALAFDALDNADGLATILHILEKYHVRSTFFINGEFIRRVTIYSLDVLLFLKSRKQQLELGMEQQTGSK